MITKTTRIALAAAFAALTASTAALASEEVTSVEINLAGYDLGNPAQVAKLKTSIRMAARNVCGMKDDDGLRGSDSRKACFRQAVTLANAKVDARIAQRTTPAASAPARNCPSMPMFQTPALSATSRPAETISSGAIIFAVSVKPSALSTLRSRRMR
jgi:UrcA family protein